jgi:ATP adenylyltransferase
MPGGRNHRRSRPARGNGTLARHEQLWAPWRLAYVSGDTSAPPEGPRNSPLSFLPGADPDCFICRGIADSDDRGNLIVERTEQSVVILNRFPYNNGHLLIAPLRHQGRLDELVDHEHVDLQRLTVRYVALIERLMKGEAFNIGLNLGRIAGAGVPGHLHWHVVPRWHGDTNFMPAVAAVRVIPQSLEALWEMFHEANSPSGQPTEHA